MPDGDGFSKDLGMPNGDRVASPQLKPFFIEKKKKQKEKERVFVCTNDYFFFF